MINSPVRKIKCSVQVLNDKKQVIATYTEQSNLISATIERVGEDSKFFGFGICQKANIKLIDTTRAINLTTNNYLRVGFGEGEGVVDFTTLPLFQITESRRDENTNSLSITAYDAIYRTAEQTIDELQLAQSYTIKQAAEAVGRKMGYSVSLVNCADSFNTSYSAGANYEGKELVREFLNDIAEATQTIYYLGKDQLYFKRLDKNAVSKWRIDKNDYFTLKSGENKRLATIISATELGDDIEATSSFNGSTQYVRNNGFWDLRADRAELVNRALAAVGGLTINQFSCNWRGNYNISLGDKIELTTKDNKSVIAYVLNDVITYDGSFNQKTQWKYSNAEKETSANPTTLGEALNQTYAKVDKQSKEITILASDIKENAEAIAQILIDTGKVNITVSKSVKSVSVTYALGDSRTTAPTSGWSEKAPVNDGSKFMWQRTITILNNGTAKETKTCISGADGAKGDKGETGAKGDKGETGAAGKNGTNGKDGYTPVKGVDYFDGKNGKDGATGAKGDKGDKGETGASGKDGYTPIKGVDYFDGAKGETGAAGSDGKDGYTPQKNIDYFNCKDGKDGAKGEKGDKGETGAAGKDGARGEKGDDGYTPVKGVDYFDGKDGAKGEKGERGEKGETGAAGSDGKDGANGKDGKDGYTPIKGKDYFDGEKGDKGDKGQSITNVTTEYYLSSSKTEQIDGIWKTEPEAWSDGWYLWTRDKITYENPTATTYTTPFVATEWENLHDRIKVLDNTVSNLTVESNKINATVENIQTSVNTSVEDINNSIISLTQKVDATMTEDQVKIEIQKGLTQGVNKVETSTGFTFDETGLSISKTNQEMKTQITENGMKVLKDNEAVLTANNAGVDAKNLHATTYLIIGKNSRFEDIGNRTGCFYIGG